MVRASNRSVMHLLTLQPGNCVLCTLHSARWGSIAPLPFGRRGQYRKRTAYHHEPLVRRLQARVYHEPATRTANRANGVRKPEDSLSRVLFYRKDIRYSVLSRLILEQWNTVRHQLGQWDQSSAELEGWGIKNRYQLRKWISMFQVELEKLCNQAAMETPAGKQNPAYEKLRQAFLEKNKKGLAAELKYTFSSFVVGNNFTKADMENQRRLADLRYPMEWFPETRSLQRKIHLHVGPTNSGKTYQALQRLEAAESGIYAGPLRLLAHEVYTRMNAKGKVCALITGEERRIPENQKCSMSSCTVEMVPYNKTVDVAVIDEIQMMGDPERGWAWTEALLGVRAKEVHLCGELRVVPLVQALCAAMGDSLEIHQYKRLSPLKVMNTSLKGDLKKLRKGDAVILFSRVAIHAMKKDIERTTGKRCAIVYGSLPPETRAQQANLFNDPNNDYDFLVASDAVGMGLNLSIKRIIFESTSKHDGISFRAISTSEIKQIAGRAGRYRTAAQAIQNSLAPQIQEEETAAEYSLEPSNKKKSQQVGLVTTLEDFDLALLQRAMATEAEPLASAGVLPPDNIVARFAAYFPPKTPFSYILLRLHEISRVNPRFHLCRVKDQILVADAIQPYDLTVADRIIFAGAPANLREEGCEEAIKAFAKCVAEQSSGKLLDFKEIKLELLDESAPLDIREHLRKLEALHKVITLYLWLSYRFAGVFISQPLAFHVKGIVEENIDKYLDRTEISAHRRQQLKILRRRAVETELKGALTRRLEAPSDKAVRAIEVALPPGWRDADPKDQVVDLPQAREARLASSVD